MTSIYPDDSITVQNSLVNILHRIVMFIPRGIFFCLKNPNVQVSIIGGITGGLIALGAYTTTRYSLVNMYPENLSVLISLSLLFPEMILITCYSVGLIQLMNVMKN